MLVTSVIRPLHQGKARPLKGVGTLTKVGLVFCGDLQERVESKFSGNATLTITFTSQAKYARDSKVGRAFALHITDRFDPQHPKWSSKTVRSNPKSRAWIDPSEHYWNSSRTQN